jgi:hypothetical protein
MGRESQIEEYTAQYVGMDASLETPYLFRTDYKYQCFTFLIFQHDDCKNEVFWPSIFHLN